MKNALEKAKRWVEEELGTAVVSMRQLPGSTSSTLYEMTTIKGVVVLRQLDNQEWLLEEPDVVRHEAMSLQKASTGRLLAPSLIAFDETGEISGLPSILMTKVEGSVELQPADFEKWVEGLATALIGIHGLAVAHFPWQYASYTSRDEVEVPKWTKKQAVWQAAFDQLQSPVPDFKETFIHRDFHPANILWLNGEVSGIVDWPNACLGPAGIDIGHCRVNLALLYGVEVADLFLRAYKKAAGTSFPYDSYWDIVSAFDFLDGPPTVYPGWASFGVTDLTDAMMEERLDAFVGSLF
ncbi:aminoglycoside phosphotransferase family protein [Sporosarcina sp. FSL K6-1522]|uniref:phosphotransferase family protein n=1 Tax=Sporosarcina sp. FSL K6-1522 TaxID=2921554 RepID=UPI00315A062C